MNELLGVDMAQQALKSRAFKAFCILGLASSAFDSYLGIENIDNHEYKSTASSALHITVELAATAGLFKLRKMESGTEYIIGLGNIVENTQMLEPLAPQVYPFPISA